MIVVDIWVQPPGWWVIKNDVTRGEAAQAPVTPSTLIAGCDKRIGGHP
jgi:hypothetical protein